MTEPQPNFWGKCLDIDWTRARVYLSIAPPPLSSICVYCQETVLTSFLTYYYLLFVLKSFLSYLCMINNTVYGRHKKNRNGR